MNGGISIGCLFVLCGSLFSYAADKGGLEPSLSLLVAEGGALSLPLLHAEIQGSLSRVHSPLLVRSKTTHSDESRSSASRRSSDEQDYLKDTDTEASFATLGSLPPSAENSPKNGMHQKKSVHQKILEQARNLQEPITRLVACVSGLDEHQQQEAREQLIRNLIAQTIALGEAKKINPILEEQWDVHLKNQIEQIHTKDFCECVIL